MCKGSVASWLDKRDGISVNRTEQQGISSAWTCCSLVPRSLTARFTSDKVVKTSSVNITEGQQNER